MSDEKIVFYVELDMQKCVIFPEVGRGADAKEYKPVFCTDSSLYVVRKSINCRGWDAHMPRLANCVVNHHLEGGGSAIDVRLVEVMRKKSRGRRVKDTTIGVMLCCARTVRFLTYA